VTLLGIWARAEAAVAQQGRAQRPPEAVGTPHAPRASSPSAGLGPPQPAQPDPTRSPLRRQRLQTRHRVLAPQRSVAIPVPRIWASIKLPDTTGTKPCYSTTIAPLFPTLPVQRAVQPGTLTFCDKYAYTL